MLCSGASITPCFSGLCLWRLRHRQLGPPICHQLKVGCLLTVSQSLQDGHVVMTSNTPFSFVYSNG